MGDGDGVSVHSPCNPPPSSDSSFRKEEYEVELEIKLLEALAIYPPNKLRVGDGTYCVFAFGILALNAMHLSKYLLAGIHRHFVLYGLMEYLRRSFGKQFSSTDVLQLLDRFYDLEMMKPDDEDLEMPSLEEEFCLPQSYFVKEE